MTPDQQIDWLTERISWGVKESADARKITINKPAMRRCMMSRRQIIVDDFNSLCDDGILESRSALDDRLQHYFWSCVGAEKD